MNSQILRGRHVRHTYCDNWKVALVYFQLTFSACPMVYISLLCSGSPKPFHQSAPQSCQRSHSGPLVTKFDHWTLSHPFFFCMPSLSNDLPNTLLNISGSAGISRTKSHSCHTHPLRRCCVSCGVLLHCAKGLKFFFRVFRKYFYLVTNGATTSSKRLKCAYRTRASTAKSDNRRHNVIVVNKTQGRR